MTTSTKRPRAIAFSRKATLDGRLAALSLVVLSSSGAPTRQPLSPAVRQDSIAIRSSPEWSPEAASGQVSISSAALHQPTVEGADHAEGDLRATESAPMVETGRGSLSTGRETGPTSSWWRRRAILASSARTPAWSPARAGLRRLQLRSPRTRAEHGHHAARTRPGGRGPLGADRAHRHAGTPLRVLLGRAARPTRRRLRPTRRLAGPCSSRCCKTTMPRHPNR